MIYEKSYLHVLYVSIKVKLYDLLNLGATISFINDFRFSYYGKINEGEYY